MQRNRVYFAIVLGLVLATGTIGLEAEQDDVESPRSAKAQQIARAWFDSLMRGDTAVTTSLSDVPFAVDRKRVIESLRELERLYEEMVSKKGKRDMKVTEIKSVNDKNEISDNAFPSDNSINTS